MRSSSSGADKHIDFIHFHRMLPPDSRPQRLEDLRMPHETTLIATVVMGLVFAFGFGFLASKLRLPPLVGYLVAGMAVGPFTPGFVADGKLAGELAEIGVMLLMFGVGLHFSIKDLMAVRRIAIPGALGQIVFATALGAAVARFWGWPLGAGLVFGLALSVASTVVLLRALEERQALDTENGRIAVGWLIVEDLAMVLALVLLPAFSGLLGGVASETGQSLLLTLGLTLGKIVLFLALMLIGGKRIVPFMLGAVARTNSRELFTLSVLATALGIAYGSAELFGVSFALGAFFAGVVLSESDFSHKAAADSLPLQDAFAVLFFVSVGMLFDPSILVQEPVAVLSALLIVTLGKSLAAALIVRLAGYSVGTALTVSASLAQIGEFSFILAGLGLTLKLLPQEGLNLILAAALLSITLNPLMFFLLCDLPKRFGRGAKPGPAEGSAPEPTAAFKGHAIIIGYGRVGRTVLKLLRQEGLDIVVIEQDRRLVEELRAEGLTAILGDAASPGVLATAGAAKARIVLVATPSGFQTGPIIERARALNPAIDTAIRTHSEAELAILEQDGVGMAIMGERELALGLAFYAFRSLGLAEEAAGRIIREARISGDGGAFERRFTEPGEGAPELRRRKADEASSA
jgi:CPA2 family monovalent cation:H+ antiporter-2